MKSAVVVLGYNVNESNFDEVVWGRPPDCPGRLVKGAAIFLEEDADIFFITGCGGRDNKEGVEIMRDLLYSRAQFLEEFTAFPIFQIYHHSIILDKLEQAMKLERRNSGEWFQTTSRTMGNIGPHLISSQIKKVILVSSPDHISRCMRDALVYWKGTSLTLNLSASPSVTLYSARSEEDREIAKMENVLVLDPPFYPNVGKMIRELIAHRGDKELLGKVSAVLNEGA